MLSVEVKSWLGFVMRDEKAACRWVGVERLGEKIYEWKRLYTVP